MPGRNKSQSRSCLITLLCCYTYEAVASIQTANCRGCSKCLPILAATVVMLSLQHIGSRMPCRLQAFPRLTTRAVRPSDRYTRNTRERCICLHKPWRTRSLSFIFAKSHALSKPCSDRSIPRTAVRSCTGGLLTRETMTTGSVSRMIPSSMISSMANDTRS